MIKQFITFLFVTFGCLYLVSYIIHLGNPESFEISFSSFIHNLGVLNSEFDFTEFFGGVLKNLNIFTNACDRLADYFSSLGDAKFLDILSTIGEIFYSFFNTLLVLIFSIAEYLIYLVSLIVKILKFIFG